MNAHIFSAIVFSLGFSCLGLIPTLCVAMEDENDERNHRPHNVPVQIHLPQDIHDIEDYCRQHQIDFVVNQDEAFAGGENRRHVIVHNLFDKTEQERSAFYNRLFQLDIASMTMHGQRPNDQNGPTLSITFPEMRDQEHLIRLVRFEDGRIALTFPVGYAGANNHRIMGNQ